MSEHVPRNDLIVGKRYRIFLEDCCIEGTAIGKFIGFVDKEYGELMFDSIEFVNSSAVKFEEIKDE